MSEFTAPGTKGFVHFPGASYLSHAYRPVIVTEAKDNLIWVEPDRADKDAFSKRHAVYEASRSLVAAPGQKLILEGEPGYEKAVKHWKYDQLRAHTSRLVRAWDYDQDNPGKALQASEALRVLASTPAPEGH